MIGAGIDLATQPAGTAGCLLDWETRKVLDVRVGLDDHAIAALHAHADITAIGSPLGSSAGTRRESPGRPSRQSWTCGSGRPSERSASSPGSAHPRRRSPAPAAGSYGA